MHRAANGCHNEIVELLIAEGADVNAKTKRGETPLDLAIQTARHRASLPFGDASQPETAALLRKHGGKTGEALKAEGK